MVIFVDMLSRVFWKISKVHESSVACERMGYQVIAARGGSDAGHWRGGAPNANSTKGRR